MAEQEVLTNLELALAIVQWLKFITLEEEEITIAEDNVPELPRRWTGVFAGLARVNRAFFHASIEVLWARMDSLMPLFGYILPNDKDKDGRPSSLLGFQRFKVTPNHWERFKLYSSKVKVLSLSAESAVDISPGWMAYLLDSTDRPATFFPNLQHLLLSSANTLSLFIASNVASNIRSLDVDLAGKAHPEVLDNGRALAARLAQNAVALTHLRLTHPTTPNIVSNVSQITSLTTLHLSLAHGQDAGKINLHQLSRLSSLAALSIEQKLKPGDRKVAAVFPKGSLEAQLFVEKESTLKRLSSLSVKANPTTQFVIATELLPVGLEKLELEIMADTLNTQMVLIPLVTTVYAKRNPRLTTLSLSRYESHSTSVDPEVLAPLRSDIQHTNFEPLMSSLSELRMLTDLTIRDIPFMCIDIVPRVYMITRGLPNLKTLILDPDAITTLEADELVLPNLRILEEIAACNPRLTWLETAIDFNDDGTIPEPPVGLASTHQLNWLALYSTVEIDELSAKEKLNLARYIDRIFPHAEILMAEWAENNSYWEPWEFVNDLLHFARETRERAILNHGESEEGATGEESA